MQGRSIEDGDSCTLKHLGPRLECGVKALSLYMFSIKNCKLPDEELWVVMQCLMKGITVLQESRTETRLVFDRPASEV